MKKNFEELQIKYKEEIECKLNQEKNDSIINKIFLNADMV